VEWIYVVQDVWRALVNTVMDTLSLKKLTRSWFTAWLRVRLSAFQWRHS